LIGQKVKIISPKIRLHYDMKRTGLHLRSMLFGTNIRGMFSLKM